jgi:hypothetical protein
MLSMNLTIYRGSDGLELVRGTPRELGIDGAAMYVNFIYGRTEILVWAECNLSGDEKKNISREILDYLYDPTSESVKQLGLIAN